MPSLLHQLESHATRRGGAPALVESAPQGQGRSITWRELLDASIRFANGLAARVLPGGAVLLIAPNCIEYMVAFHGCLLADAAVFPLSPQFTAAEWREAATKSGAAACVGDARVLRDLESAVPIRIPLDAVALDSSDGHQTLSRPYAGTGSMLLQSSGTTGLPKIVRRPLAALEAVGENCRDAIGMQPDDRILTIIPLCHSYGIDHAVMGAAMAGCTVELCGGFDVLHVQRVLRSERITLFPAVPFILESLTQASQQPAQLRRLRRVYSAGTTLPPRVYESFAAAFGVPIGQVYGSTEFGSVTYNDPAIEPFDPYCVGRPLAGVEIRVVDREQPRLAAPVGEEGQLLVAAPSMFSEYLDHAEPFIDGAFPSGDLGRRDAQGRITITGRIKLLIDVGGLKVNPLEVESVLSQHPAVRQVVVVGVPVSDTVNRVKAIVVWKQGGGDVEELRSLARARLAPYKVPRVIEERESLPCTPTGKILRNAVLSA